MSKTVRVVCCLPCDGFSLRAPRVDSAFDDAQHAAPQNLELRAGINDGIPLEVVEYWKRNTRGITWTQHGGDTVLLEPDRALAADESTRLKLRARSKGGARGSDAAALRNELTRVERRTADDSAPDIIERALNSNRIVTIT